MLCYPITNGLPHTVNKHGKCKALIFKEGNSPAVADPFPCLHCHYMKKFIWTNTNTWWCGGRKSSAQKREDILCLRVTAVIYSGSTLFGWRLLPVVKMETFIGTYINIKYYQLGFKYLTCKVINKYWFSGI